jgi:hypothetical protein
MHECYRFIALFCHGSPVFGLKDSGDCKKTETKATNADAGLVFSLQSE